MKKILKFLNFLIIGCNLISCGLSQSITQEPSINESTINEGKTIKCECNIITPYSEDQVDYIYFGIYYEVILEFEYEQYFSDVFIYSAEDVQIINNKNYQTSYSFIKFTFGIVVENNKTNSITLNYGAQQTSFNKTYNVVLNSHKSNLLRKYKINKMHDFVPIQINNAFDYKKYCSLYGVSGSNLSSHFFEKNNIFFILWGVTSKNISIEFIDLFAHHNVLYYQLKVVNKKGDLTCDISQNYLFEISLPNDIKLPTLFKEAIFQMGV